MVEKGHFEELQNLLEMINADEEKKKNRQTFVFSATLTLIHDLPKHLKNKKKQKNLTQEEKLLQVGFIFLLVTWLMVEMTQKSDLVRRHFADEPEDKTNFVHISESDLHSET